MTKPEIRINDEARMTKVDRELIRLAAPLAVPVFARRGKPNAPQAVPLNKNACVKLWVLGLIRISGFVIRVLRIRHVADRAR